MYVQKVTHPKYKSPYHTKKRPHFNILFLSAAQFKFLQGSDGARRSSHSETLDEELQATGCAAPTPQQGHTLSCEALVKVQ